VYPSGSAARTWGDMSEALKRGVDSSVTGEVRDILQTIGILDAEKRANSSSITLSILSWCI
jgi:hypothetical protein